MTHVPHRSARALVAVAVVVGLAGCAPEPDADIPTNGEATQAPVTPAPSAEPSAEPVDPSTVECPDLLPSDLLDTFAESGWTSVQEPFMVGAETFPDGLSCRWGDLTAGGGGGLQIYGWALADADDADAAASVLEEQGWVREKGTNGFYVTENPETVVSGDADGYGMTYFFGEGWIALSDTKEGLLVIQRPAA